eukprot:COSAG02_NODE_154_length_33067_cov_38.282092_6_plen_107_part_00
MVLVTALTNQGNFYCEELHWDGGDCLTDDACSTEGDCSLCGGHWDAVMAACPTAEGSSVVPSACEGECSTLFSEWWEECSVEETVRSLDTELGGELGQFASKCTGH